MKSNGYLTQLLYSKLLLQLWAQIELFSPLMWTEARITLNESYIHFICCSRNNVLGLNIKQEIAEKLKLDMKSRMEVRDGTKGLRSLVANAQDF